MKRFLETGNFAITEGAIIAGCRFFAGYPITPATELAEAMSLRLPQVGGVYIQAEDECAAMHMCIGASLGGMKAMTATSGRALFSMRTPSAGPWVARRPGRPEFGPGGSRHRASPVPRARASSTSPVIPRRAATSKPSRLAPNSAQEAMAMVVEAFYLSERFRMPIIVLADQLITDGFEDITVPENEDEMKEMGFRIWPRHFTGVPTSIRPRMPWTSLPYRWVKIPAALCSDWTPTEEGYDIEEVEAHHKHAYRLIYKVRNNRGSLTITTKRSTWTMTPNWWSSPTGRPSRVVNTAVEKARSRDSRSALCGSSICGPSPMNTSPRKPSTWSWSSTGTGNW